MSRNRTEMARESSGFDGRPGVGPGPVFATGVHAASAPIKARPFIPDGGHVVAAIGFAVLVTLALQMPRATPAWLALIAIASLPTLRSAGAFRGPPMRTGLLSFTFVLFTSYAMASALWAVEPMTSVGKVLLLALFMGLAGLAVHAFGFASDRRLRALQIGLVIAVTVGVIFFLFELLTDQAIRRFLVNAIPALRPSSPKDFVSEGGVITLLKRNILNQNIALFIPFLWPAAAAVGGWRKLGSLRFVLMAAMVLGALFAAVISEHETSALAIGFGLAILLAAMLSNGFARGVVIAGWLAATLLVVPAAQGAYATGLHKAEWLPWTARARIILWDYTAEQWRKRPFLGVGVRSTKPLDEAHVAAGVVRPEGYVYGRRTGRHSHNVFMQTWFELGAIGAVLLSVLGLAMIREISATDRRTERWLLALFTSGMVMAAFSWGMWQAWFLAYYGLAFVTAGLMVRVAQREPPPTVA